MVGPFLGSFEPEKEEDAPILKFARHAAVAGDGAPFVLDGVENKFVVLCFSSLDIPFCDLLSKASAEDGVPLLRQR